MKPLIIIPARGGSKGIPGKNIKLLSGKPLIQYTIEVARAIFDDSLICVSTDDINIKMCVEGLGLKVPFLRPIELAADDTGTHEVLLHALSFYEGTGYFADTIILLQPTSPFRTELQLLDALDFYTSDIDMLVSVKAAAATPYTLLEENELGLLKSVAKGSFTRRQDLPEFWQYNGAIYIINVLALKNSQMSEFKQIKKFVMNDVTSHDIDTVFDWEVAKCICSLNKVT